MLNVKFWLLIACVLGIWSLLPTVIPEDKKNCREAFVFQFDDHTQLDTIRLCVDSAQVPDGYQTVVNMAVCDDSLCAKVVLKLKWDLAGNYSGFDTLPGIPLTKFDHKKFSGEDYKKLDRILKDKNSMLRILEKDELIDKSIKLKATTVDAVTGATPATVKNAVVEGAVYTSYSLWHLVNGALADSMRAYTRSVYSDGMAVKMLNSTNYETQLFALRQMSEDDYNRYRDLLLQVMQKSSPIIRAYIIGKLSLPFQNQDENERFAGVFPKLDAYSKSIFINRITSEKQAAMVFLPLLKPWMNGLSKAQREQVLSGWKKFEIPGYSELQEKLEGKSE